MRICPGSFFRFDSRLASFGGEKNCSFVFQLLFFSDRAVIAFGASFFLFGVLHGRC